MAHESEQSCIDACNACADACDHCIVACLNEADPAQLARCIALDIDCAQLCRLAAAFMARGTEVAKTLCDTCAQVCQRCAQACRSMVGEATQTAG